MDVIEIEAFRENTNINIKCRLSIYLCVVSHSPKTRFYADELTHLGSRRVGVRGLRLA